MSRTLTPMDPRRKAGVRALLVAEAAPSPTRPPVVRRRAVALAATAAVTVVAAVMLVADPAAPPSYATWTAVPSTASGGSASDDEIERWSSACNDLTHTGVGVEGVPARPADAARRKVLVDRRGDFTFCVDVSAGSGTEADPLIAVSGLRAGELSQGWGTTSDKAFPPTTGGDVVVLGGDLRTPPASTREPGVTSLDAYQLYGTAGPEVTRVDVVLRNGLRVTATVRHGLWGAWWPTGRGDPTAAELEIRTPAGVRTVLATEVQWDEG